jgi:hypothetical protein
MASYRQRDIMPGGKWQWIALLLSLINGLMFSYLVFPCLINQLGLRPIDSAGEHYRMVPGLLAGQGLAWEYQSGITFVMAKEPGYTFMLAMLDKIFGALDVRLVQLVQIVLNTFICWMVWTIGYLSTQKRTVATLAAFIYACYPTALLYSARIWNDIPSSFWVLLSVFFFLLTLRDRSILKGALTGWSLAIAVLFRTASFGLFFLFLAFLFFTERVPLQNDQGIASIPSAQKAKIALTMAILFFLVLSPWAARNWVISGRPVMLVTVQSWATWIDGGEVARLWNRKDNMWPKDTEVKKFDLVRSIYNEEIKGDASLSGIELELRVHDRLRSFVIEDILKDPTGYMQRVGKSALLFWYLGSHRFFSYGMLLVTIILIPLAVIGAILSLARRRIYLVLLASTMTYIWLIYAMVISYCRYSLVAVPFAIILAAYAYEFLYKRMQAVQKKSV